MRIKIEYSNDAQANSNFPYWAKSIVNGNPICTCGTSWEQVRKEHIERIALASYQPEPPMSEEVEV